MVQSSYLEIDTIRLIVATAGANVVPDLGKKPGLWFGDHTLLLYPGRNVASRHEKIFLTLQILFP